MRITGRDFLLADRKAAREEEILAHGKPIAFRSHVHCSKKKDDRKQSKKAITHTDDGFSYCHSGSFILPLETGHWGTRETPSQTDQANSLANT